MDDCVYTPQKTKKVKKWKDGFVTVGNGTMKLYGEDKRLLMSSRRYEIEDDCAEMGEYLIQSDAFVNKADNKTVNLCNRAVNIDNRTVDLTADCVNTEDNRTVNMDNRTVNTEDDRTVNTEDDRSGRGDANDIEEAKKGRTKEEVLRFFNL